MQTMKQPHLISLQPWLEHGAERKGTELLVLHATAGSSASGAIDTLRERGLSYHYIVAKSGEIIKCAPTSVEAYHAGNSYGPLEEARGLSREQDSEHRFVCDPGVNHYSIGISFVNMNDGVDGYTPEQTESGLWLAARVRDEFPGLKWVSTHAILSPGRKSDPLGYDLDAFASSCGLKPWRYGE